MKGKTTATYLNVRQGPGSTYNVVGSLPNGTEVEWDISENGWLNIGREEWIHGDWVMIENEDEQPKPPNTLLLRPVNARISQLWGDRHDYYYKTFRIPGHNGVDYAASQGTPILSVSDGQVRTVAYDPTGYGNWMEIYHPALRLYSFYAHLLRADVISGQLVKAGQPIGLMGSTGNSTGPHLHFEIRLASSTQPEHMEFPYYADPIYAGHTRGRVNPETIYAILERLPKIPTPVMGEVVPENVTTPEMLEDYFPETGTPQPRSEEPYPPEIARGDLAFYFINADWQEQKSLVTDERLMEAAQARADDMVAKNYLSHENPDGVWPNQHVRDYHYNLPENYPNDSNWVESLAAGYPSPYAALEGLHNSPAHYGHITGSDFWTTHSVFGVGYRNDHPKFKFLYVILTAPPEETTPTQDLDQKLYLPFIRGGAKT